MNKLEQFLKNNYTLRVVLMTLTIILQLTVIFILLCFTFSNILYTNTSHESCLNFKIGLVLMIVNIGILLIWNEELNNN